MSQQLPVSRNNYVVVGLVPIFVEVLLVMLQLGMLIITG